MQGNPTVFISYAWESDEIKSWVIKLATKLREKGINASIDQWSLAPGDQIPHFMEKALTENDYVLIICTPTYKNKSEKRIGGVGYEGDIMTAQVLQNSNHRKFIPILRIGDVELSMPSWLKGKWHVNLSDESLFNNNLEDLTATIFNQRKSAPKLGDIPHNYRQNASPLNLQRNEADDEIKIQGIITDMVTSPSYNGSPGCLLYKIPFKLNQSPNQEWINFFIYAFDNPSEYTTMHRPGIAYVLGDKIYLDGTTIEEVDKYHKKTLKLAVNEANKKQKESIQKRIREEEASKVRLEQFRKNIDDMVRNINFDD